MPQKIFISYRRQDSGANAIGIGQYLEKEFGRKNVYIDVGMHAGTKYPAVIEKRLAECRVLLVLIGPDWLTSKDEHGHLRLQKSDDWVRLEIAQALKRDITVIPVLINGAQLPDREMLPVDIQGLLDHQAALVSVGSFRHEMAGLVSDIRSIKVRRSWRLLGGIAAAVLILLTGLVLVLSFGFQNLLERARVIVSSPTTVAIKQNDFWKSRPGEWILFAYDSSLNAYFFSPGSIKTFGDGVAYTSRFVLKSNAVSSSQNTLAQGAYEDDNTVVDCKKPVLTIAERTVYSIAGEILFNFKYGEPKSLDLHLSKGQSFNSGSIAETAQYIMCDEKLRAVVKRRPDAINLSYLANSPNGDGTVFNGPINPTSNSTYPFETLFVDKKFTNHEIAELFSEKNVRGLPSTYRSSVQNVQMNCAERKILTPTFAYYDESENLVYLQAQLSAQPLDAKSGSIFDSLLSLACGGATNVVGNYEGINTAKYKKGGAGEQKIAISIQQNGSDLKLKFQTANGGQGEGTGKLGNNRVDTLSLRSTAPECPGSYDGSLSFADNSMSWSYKGQDCGGPMEGRGTAKKVTR